MDKKQLLLLLKRFFTKNANNFSLVSVALFGSWAKNQAQPSSDIDLLLVGQDKSFNKKNTVLAVKKMLAFPLELLALTKTECEENFKSHNPLFLDIALDAEIIIDTDDYLKNLIKQTVKYLENSPLQRLPDGWRLPVKKGTVTYLSLSNKEIATAWLKEADRDLKTSAVLINSQLWDKAVYHLQQTVEKNIKAILSALGYYKKSHFVANELQKAVTEFNFSEPWLSLFKEVTELALKIEPEVTLTRYPKIEKGKLISPSEEYTQNQALEFLTLAEKVFTHANEFVNWWFS